MNRCKHLRLCALPLALLLLSGCGDEKVVDPGPSVHASPEAMITEDFAEAYAAMDSVRYAALLDSNYTFELLDDEPDPDFPGGWWDRSEELAIAGNMFKARFNPGGQKVRDIRLTLQVKTSVVDNTAYPEKPTGETWKRITTYVDLRVVADDPGDVSGTMNFIVSSDQIFIVRPDPAHANRYVVYKQIDQPSINKGRPAALAGTQNESWTGVKALFR